MKKERIYRILFLLPLMATMSCKKSFLEIKPNGVMIAQTVSDYRNLFLSLAPLSDNNSDATVYLGDDVAGLDIYAASASIRGQRLFHYEADVYEPNEDADEMAMMKSVYLYNKIVQEVMDATEGTESEKIALRAEAQACRAWSYFMLINYYGKPYDPSTAADDLGVPIVKVADVTAGSFTRASVQAVYDFIIEDLTTAIPLLPTDQPYRYKMSKSAAEAILAKVYVFMGKYNAALPLLNNALEHLPVSFNVKLYDYAQTLAPAGEWAYTENTPTSYIAAGPLGADNTEALLDRSFINSTPIFGSSFLLDPATLALYDSPSDLRLKCFSQYAYGDPTAFPVSGLRRMLGPFMFTPQAITLPEVYLLRAECLARANDLEKAKADLKTLRLKRMNETDANVHTTDQEELIRFVISERIREFALKGYRWFDMRRLSKDPLFANTTYKHRIFAAANGAVSATYTLTPERMVLRFPKSLMAQNPGMDNNP